MSTNPELLLWMRTLALECGSRMIEAAAAREQLHVEQKGRVDLVTRVDRELQAFLVGAIAAQFPDETIVAEEDGLDADAGAAGAVWYVDPLDGTTNFVHGYPFYCVSIARWVDGRPSEGVVYAPALDELYAAAAGAGATLERPQAGSRAEAITVRACPSLDRALLATGFPYERGLLARLNLAVCAEVLTVARGIRRGGSAALDLCHVAAGRLDGYWEFGLKAWDLAAGMLVAREAGARVEDFVGGADPRWEGRILAAGSELFDALRARVVAAHEHCDLDVLAPRPSGPLPLSGPLPGAELR